VTTPSADFTSPTFNQGGQGLTVNIGPLGLVELSDEEFEVHGPRLNRYSLNWAFYLGRHWAYQREAGEPQLTFNWFRAFSDFIATFTFGRGVTFSTPKQTESIVPDLLQRVWEVDNNKNAVLWEMAQQGGVSGDCFVKVAYEEPFVDSIDRLHPGRVRILPLNSAHCFPEWHPHDRERIIRFKLKYRFYGQTPEGTRQVFTYTEIITDDSIAEYLNDVLIQTPDGTPNPRPNPIGKVPVVHIANTLVSGSPWGLADCQDITALNREYNEKATEISDIINYHAAPVTVVLGAKASNLEKGPKKVWAIPNAGADVKNLELGAGIEAGPMAFLELLKRTMHEMTGVPETALGQVQPISNTSGVALSIQYQPLMARFNQKVNQYSQGLVNINELIMLTLVAKEKEALAFDQGMDLSPLKPGQLEVLDPSDPITYRTTCHFPPPLPIDKLILLNEIQLLQSLGLESREGALRLLGEEDPAEKLAEIRAELKDDAVADGALQLIKTQIQSEIMNLTGIMPTPDGGELPPMQDGAPDALGNTVGSPQMPEPAVDMAQILEQEGEMEIRNRIVTEAFGTKIPQRRNPDGAPQGENQK
jgi:hypothetical protein